nr:hypothetical protein Iba_chr04aCG3890 [Ipomoea batatas]GMC87899.1 hypothetical protein Iba_chr04eCG4890 [Ipomoea batatas]
MSGPPIEQLLSGFLGELPLLSLLHELLLEASQVSAVFAQKLTFQFPVFDLRVYETRRHINLLFRRNISVHCISTCQFRGTRNGKSLELGFNPGQEKHGFLEGFREFLFIFCQHFTVSLHELVKRRIFTETGAAGTAHGGHGGASLLQSRHHLRRMSHLLAVEIGG